jgi:FMN hydrolase / 5-amino-6-(5-phospho-D-ribitylamino)uracil phosphatase
VVPFTSMLHDVRAVAFDLDNTLWDVGPVLERAELRLHQWLSEHCPRIPERVSAAGMRDARAALAREEPHNAHDFTYLRIASLARHARECGYDEEIAQRAFDVFFAARNEVELFADVRPALQRLRSRYALATLSNGNADLTSIGLAEFFVLSLNARQIGVGKPHPRCFERLTQELRLQPHQVVYVGDDPVLDVEAARASGLATAWVNRFGLEWPQAIAPADIVATDCTQLADALRAQ